MENGFQVILDHPSSVKVDTDLISHRIDSHFFSTKYIFEYSKLVKSGLKIDSFEELSKRMNSGPFGSALLASQYVEVGVPFVRPFNCKNYIVDDTEFVFISIKDNVRLSSSRFKAGDLLITKIGNGIGDLAIVPQHIIECNISGNLMGAVVKEEYDNYYVLTFLKSVYGQKQIIQGSTNSAKPKIDMDAIKNVKIPVPKKEIQFYIGNKVRKAEHLREEAKRLRKEVKDLFYNYTLLDGEKDTSRDSTENSKNEWGMFVDTRNITNLLGAEVYKSDYVENQKIIRSLDSYVNFDDCFEYIVNGVDSRNYKDNATAYYKVAAIDMYGVKEGSVDFVDITIDNINTKQRIEEGDLLITRKGSFGISMGVQARDTNGVISSEVFKVRLKKGWDADYLAYFLNSRYGQKQFLQFATGSTMKGISQQNIVEIVVPKIEYHKQQEIGSIVRDIKDLYYQSKKLIQQAKNDVESLIEGTFDESTINEEQ